MTPSTFQRALAVHIATASDFRVNRKSGSLLFLALFYLSVATFGGLALAWAVSHFLHLLFL